MKEVIDNFSDASSSYKKFRPTYPPQLYQAILAQTEARRSCWDCGTGNGQVAAELSKYFEQVYATDVSENQISHSVRKDNIIYKAERAEKTSFADEQFDIITVAQAIHWFDLKKFDLEVARVLKPKGLLFIWGYGLIRIEKEIDKVIDHLYTQEIGPYWDRQRKYIDEHYQGIELNLSKMEAPQSLSITQTWTLDSFIGYLRTWSSVKKYWKAHDDHDPTLSVKTELQAFWEPEEKKDVRFPIFMQIWQKA